MGGYVVTWPGNFHYLTIRGSGHSEQLSLIDLSYLIYALCDDSVLSDPLANGR